MKNRIKEHKGVFIAILLILLVYGIGLVFFSSHAYPNTSLNGQDVGFQHEDEIFAADNAIEAVQVQGEFGEELLVQSEEIEYEPVFVGENQIQQNAFLWPMEIFSSYDYEAEIKSTYNEAKLDFLIKESDFDMDGKPAQDAYIELEANEVVIVPEQIGTKIDGAALADGIIQSFEEGEETLEAKPYYDQPEITADDPDLIAEAEDLEQRYDTSITFDFVDRQYTLGGLELVEMYEEGEDGSLHLNRQALEDWVVDLAVETDTYGRTRTFNATGVGEVEVPPGIYGWQINVDETTDKLVDLLEEGGHVETEPVYNMTAMDRSSNDIGDTYIEVDISRQHLWAYVDGELAFESDLVSGMGDSKWETPLGVDELWSRETNRILEGSSFDTGVPYATPVNYWMPINWKGIGFHDASWRDNFGGQIYQTNGSNGCLNLPAPTAESIYETYSTGTPVVVYKSGKASDSVSTYDEQGELEASSEEASSQENTETQASESSSGENE